MMKERRVGGFTCGEVLERLDAFIAGLLDAASLASVQEHCAECDQCAQFGAAYARLVTALRSGTPEALDSARLARLQARLEREAS